MKTINTVGILGAGAFGTALGKVIIESKKNCYLWTIDDKVEKEINNKHTNEKFCGLNILPKKLIATTSLETIVKEAQVLIFSVPAIVIEQVVISLIKILKENNIQKKFYFVSSSKGFSPDKTTITEYLKKIIPEKYVYAIGAIAGPNLSEEIFLQKLTKTNILFDNKNDAKLISTIFKNEYFVSCINTNVISCEYISIVKNVYALFSGMVWGLGYQYNTMGWLIIEMVNEMKKILKYKNCKSIEEANGLAGLGDLLVTATNSKSRNFQTGYLLASKQHNNVKFWTSTLTVEGVNACKTLYESFKSNQIKNLPIISATYEILYSKKNISKSLKKIFNLEPNSL